MGHDMLTPPDSTPSTPAKSRFQDLEEPISSPVLSAPATSYSHSLLGVADNLTSTVASAVFSLGFPPALTGARMAILKAMSHAITWGQLVIETGDERHVFPSPSKRSELGLGEFEGQAVIVRVLQDTFWLRLVTLGDLGFAESYMAGECEVSDLAGVFKIFIKSKPHETANSISGVTTLSSRAMSLFTSITNSRFANTLSNSVSNIRAHYDLSNGMFSSFLSRDMTYSCGIFPELDRDLERKKGLANGYREGVDELEEAQLAKIRHIIRKADIRPGHRVLEIGSGWGSFAIEAVQTTGCTVDTITLSSQQKALAEKRVKAAGLAGRIRVWLMDYRALPDSWKGAFDRVVSIEMLEAVGKEFIPGYFGVIDSALNATGAACIQVITIPESRFEQYQKQVDFIQKWIFPGGFLPTVTYTIESIQKGAKNRLVVDSISNIGPHYARTLREWSERFHVNFDEKIAPALKLEHPEMSDEDVEVFRRKWNYYFCYCQVGFSERVLGDHIITMVREGNADYGCTTFE
ncbi:Mycolic acid cyclopropane synthetase-domain-containing protein [Naematelia encephala]|uniref:Mycolic acid cyclopropane synthetase-domain-containing protein n=1 Tax=Naematelia encephala TaxID=71784 RepID=A0A1Y2ADS5_9TREE|nr:Mycolic acid cyclopropane synthetase-domain-containing protein [Naematelia encephala]